MNTSIYIPDEMVEDFDDALLEAKVSDDDRFGSNMSRSEAIRLLMSEFITAQKAGNANPVVDRLAAD